MITKEEILSTGAVIRTEYSQVRNYQWDFNNHSIMSVSGTTAFIKIKKEVKNGNMTFYNRETIKIEIKDFRHLKELLVEHLPMQFPTIESIKIKKPKIIEWN